MLWGDSFAAHLAPGIALEPTALQHNVLQFTRMVCAPILPPSRQSPACERFNNEALSIMKRYDVEEVYLSAQWAGYLGSRFEAADLRRTIEAVQADGRRVVLLGQPPLFSFADPRHGISRRDAQRMRTEPIDALHRPRPKAEAALQAVGHPMLQPVQALCRGLTCTIAADGEWLFYDYGHLSTYGSRLTVRWLARELGRQTAK